MITLLSLILNIEASLLEECSPLLRDHNSTKREKQEEELAFLKDPLNKVNLWNEQLVKEKRKLEVKSELAYKYIIKTMNKVVSAELKSQCRSLMEISKEILSIFGKKSDKWITSEYIRNLQTYLLDDDIYKELDNLKETYDYFVLYTSNLIAYIKLSIEFNLLVGKLNFELMTDDVFNGKALIEEIFQIINPTDELIQEIELIRKVLKGLQKNRTGLFF